MTKTTSEAMEEAFDYLERMVGERRSDLHAYTLSGIIEGTGIADAQMLSKALKKLEEDEDITSKRIGVNVYLPRSHQANEVYRELADMGYETMRPYVSVLLGMGVAYLVMVALGGPVSETVFAAWQDGFAHAAIFGVAFGAVVQKIFTKIGHWKLKSGDAFASIVQLTTISLLIGGLLVGSYHIAISHFGRPFEPAVALGIISFAFAVTIGYAAYLRSSSSEPEDIEEDEVQKVDA